MNGGATKTYDPTEKVLVSSESVSTLRYFATDKAGNQESPAKTFTVRLERVLPRWIRTTAIAWSRITGRRGSAATLSPRRPSPTRWTRLRSPPRSSSTSGTPRRRNGSRCPPRLASRARRRRWTRTRTRADEAAWGQQEVQGERHHRRQELGWAPTGE
jgi:hypothetical protein